MNHLVANGTAFQDLDFFRSYRQSNALLSFCDTFWNIADQMDENIVVDLVREYLAIFKESPDLQFFDFGGLLFMILGVS